MNAPVSFLTSMELLKVLEMLLLVADGDEHRN